MKNPGRFSVRTAKTGISTYLFPKKVSAEKRMRICTVRHMKKGKCQWQSLSFAIKSDSADGRIRELHLQGLVTAQVYHMATRLPIIRVELKMVFYIGPYAYHSLIILSKTLVHAALPGSSRHPSSRSLRTARV